MATSVGRGHGRDPANSMYMYGQPANQGRGMPGRGMPMGRGGRIPGAMPMGRGGTMPGGRGMPMGRGGRMPGGRGMPMGRGGRMPGGRGGRVPGGRGGRMPAGRGGPMMMPGRGGRGPGGKPLYPSKLDGFNRYILFKMMSFCDRDDQETLGFAFPQFTPAPLTPEQQKMRMMKKFQETRMELKNPYGIQEDDTSNDAKDSTEASGPSVTESNEESSKDDSNVSKKEESSLDKTDTAESKEKKNDSDNAKPAEEELSPEKKKELMKEREEQMRLNMTDCDTLLAQLNTKRLYQRIKYFKKNDSNYDVDKAYAYNKNTAEISRIEWEALIEDYKTRRIALLKNKEAKDAAKAERKANQKANRSKKSKKNKKKGKNKKSRKTQNAASGKESEETKDAEKLEGSTDVANEKAENEDGSDDDDDGSISSDEESTDGTDFEYVSDKPSRYELLMFTPCPRAVSVLASYPRSGNSLMRNLYEKITLRVTGSDMMGGLQKHDLVGEMATGTNNVQFVKTHYPERMGHPPFRVSRAVLLVRNPYDAMDSYFNLMSTSTHTTSLTPEARKKYANIFAEMAKREILVWRDFHEYWLKQKIPLMVVRYEDLIRDTVKVISKVIKFVLEINSMTFFEDRIMRAIGEEQVENLGPYKARSGGIGKSLTKGYYTPQLLHQINYGIVGTMEKFGYKEMLIPNPKSWKLIPLDQWGVYIPGTRKEPLVINQKGLVRGPNRQTNWRMVKMMIEKDKKEAEKKKGEEEELPKKVDLL